MATLKTIALTCPNCAWEFVSECIDLIEVRCQKTTDFRVVRAGVEELSYGVHLCEHCGFTGPAAWFTVSQVSWQVHWHVEDEIMPVLATHPIPSSEKYEFAAKVAAWDGAPARLVADLWLRAAWCCVTERDTEAERYYRRQAARTFEEALSTYGEIPAEDRAVITYLIGELWRRIGDSRRANEWFALVPSEVTDRARQAWIVAAARQQAESPLEWFV